MSLFATIFLSPIIVGLVAAAIAYAARVAKLQKPSGSSLDSISIVLGALGAGTTLLWTIAWMIWYENSTGYSAGNGPLGWIFILGPLGIASGEAVAVVLWWFGKPQRIWRKYDA
jgi:hypothetical protein